MIGNGKDTYSDNTLMNMTKKELIGIIRCLESNLKNLDETFDIQTNNTIKLLEEMKTEYKSNIDNIRNEFVRMGDLAEDRYVNGTNKNAMVEARCYDYAVKVVDINTQIKEPLYECYETKEGKVNLRTIFYTIDQINEFCSTTGSRIMSESGRKELIDHLYQKGQVEYIWDLTHKDIEKMPIKYKKYPINISINTPNRLYEIRECMAKYLKVTADFYGYEEIGSKSYNELTFRSLEPYNKAFLTGIIGKDGYPDIINERGESVFDYKEEMELSTDDILDIRGIKEKDIDDLEDMDDIDL